MFPARVNVPEPVIAEPVSAPHSKFNEVGELILRVDMSKVAPLLTDKDPLTVKLADKVVVPIESFKLPKVVKVDEGNVFVAVKTTVPVLGVQVRVPCPIANEPVSNLELATIVIVPGASSPLVDFVNIIEPACKVEPLTKVMVPLLLEFVLPSPPTVTAPVTVSFGLPEEAKVSVPLEFEDVPPNCKLAQTALVIFTVTVPLDAIVTGSKFVGTPLGFQLLALFQLVPSPPPSQVLDVWA